MKTVKTITIIFISLGIIMVLYMVAPRFKASRSATKSEITIPHMESIKSAIGAYILNTGKLPSRLEDLIYCPEGLESSWKGPYLKETQFYDPWKNKYFLEYGYRLQSLGADGIKGGVGENADIEEFTGLIKNEN